MKRLQRACMRLLVPAIALAALAACGGDDGAGGGEEISLTGNWSGNWQKTTPVADQSGTIAATLTDNGDGTANGTVNTNLCGSLLATNHLLVKGTLGSTSFSFDLDYNDHIISFTAAFPENPMSGTYDVTTEGNLSLVCSAGWGGTFSLSK